MTHKNMTSPSTRPLYQAIILIIAILIPLITHQGTKFIHHPKYNNYPALQNHHNAYKSPQELKKLNQQQRHQYMQEQQQVKIARTARAKQYNRDDHLYKQHVFYIYIATGLFFCLLGLSLKKKLEIIGIGFIYGGGVDLLYGCLSNWDHLSNLTQFIVLICALITILVATYIKLSKEKSDLPG